MTPLSEQIMDELMQRKMSIPSLVYELDAKYESIRKAIRKLEGAGLIRSMGIKKIGDKHEMMWETVCDFGCNNVCK